MGTRTLRAEPPSAAPASGLLAPYVGLAGLLPLGQATVGVAKVLIALELLALAPGPTLPVIALATVAVYAHNDLTDHAEDGVNHPERTAALERREHGVRVAALASGLGAVGLAATGGVDALALAALPVALGVPYNARVLPGPGPDRLKELPVVNTTTTAVAWAVPVAWLPLAFGADGSAATAALATWYLFARTAVASELANVPDVAGDAAAGVRTLPVVAGTGATRSVLAVLDLLTAASIVGAAVLGVASTAVAGALLVGPALSLAVLAAGVDRPAVERLLPVQDLSFPVVAVALWVVGVA